MRYPECKFMKFATSDRDRTGCVSESGSSSGAGVGEGEGDPSGYDSNNTYCYATYGDGNEGCIGRDLSSGSGDGYCNVLGVGYGIHFGKGYE